MGKKKKKNNKGGQTAKGAQPLERQAQEHLASGRFRQAVDAFKELFKKDAEIYRPHLRAAYEGLYKQRLAKGLLQEAAMVLAQLEKLAGNVPCVDSIRLWLKRQEFTKAAEVAAKVMAATVALPGQEAALAADALVTAFEEMPRPNGLPDSIAGDLERIQSALKAVAEQQYSAALESIKPIGLRSMFISWKWLVKGLCAFYGQEDSKALAAFEKIVAGSAPGLFAAPYMRLLTKNAGKDSAAKEPAALEALCAVAGYAPIAPIMARAEYLWGVQRFRDSHAHLLNALESFPTYSVGLARTLTHFYYNAVFEMPSEQAQKYMRHLSRCASVDQNNDPVEQVWTQRTVALYMERHSQLDGPLLEQWEEFLSLYASIFGEHPKIRALVYGRLGDLFSQEAPDEHPFPFFFSRRRRKRLMFRNPELARHCYENSLKADPGAKDTRLSLIGFHEKSGDAAKVNKLLDQLIKQFPGEKDVLYKAGHRCLERKALIKAMRYLEQALALDPMDKIVRETFIIACITAALNYTRNGQADKSRELLVRVLEASDAHSDDFNRGQAYLYARWSVFEQLSGDDARAEAMWVQAMAHRHDSEVKLRFFYWIVARHYGVPPRLLKESETLIRKTLKAPAVVGIALDFADTLLYTSRLREADILPPAEMKQIHRYIARAVELEMTRPQAKIIMGYALSDACDSPDLAETCVRNMLRRNPDDAFFRYYRYLFQQEHRHVFSSLHKEIGELTTILRLAREQKEHTVTADAQKRLHALEKAQRVAQGDGNAFGDMPDNMDEDEMDEEEMEEEEMDAEVLNTIIDRLAPPRRSSRTPRHPKAKAEKQKKPSAQGPEQLELF